jgi:histidinol-phosphate aminotransferase
LIFLASPNNPTGNSVPPEQVVALLDMGLYVVIDEAYYEFAGHTVARLVNEYENLMVVRTFSKWAGLAGVRIGYAIVSPEVYAYLNQIKQPYNVSVFAQIAALESLRDVDYLMSNVNALVSERARLFDLLQAIDFLSPIPSEGNYLLCHVTRGDGRQVYNLLKQRNIFVRYYDRPNLKNCFRISVGKPPDTDRLIDALAEIGKELHG